MYLPAGAITGELAGFYWAKSIATSTTNFQFTTAYVAAITVPVPIPVNPPNAVGSAGAYTQTTSSVTLLSTPLPAGLLGVNGSITCMFAFAYTNSGATKNVSYKLGGVPLFTRGRTTTIGEYLMTVWQTRGDNAKLLELTNLSAGGTPWGGASASAGTQVTLNSAVDMPCEFTGSIPVGGNDYVVLSNAIVDVATA